MTRENVILLTIDALRSDHLSHRGYFRDTSPTLERLAKEGIVFSEAYSVSSHTREAMPAILTGKYPDTPQKGYTLSNKSIAEWLSDEEYLTAGFHSNPFLSRSFDYDKGFNEFYDDLYLGSNRSLALAQRLVDRIRNHHYARADEINKRSLEWLASIEREPFFLWNHYMDVHGPYQPPGEFRDKYHGWKYSERKTREIFQDIIEEDSVRYPNHRAAVDLYDGEINYLDSKLNVFLQKLESRGLVENTTLIITADHGDAFGEHGYYGHPRKLHKELTHVPLIIWGRDLPSKEIDVPVSTLDILPTILDSTGTINYELPGEDLRNIWVDPTSYKQRRVFSQASGEGQDSDLVRFTVRNQQKEASIEIDSKTGELLSKSGNHSLIKELKLHSQEQINSNSSIQVTDGEENESVEGRLEALGYK